MISWFVFCSLLAPVAWYCSGDSQWIPALLALLGTPVVVLFNTGDTKRTLLQFLAGLFLVPGGYVPALLLNLPSGSGLVMSLLGLLCFANAMGRPGYPLATFLVHMGFFTLLIGRQQLSPGWSVLFWLATAVAFLASSQIKPLQAKPDASLADVDVGTDNEKQSGAFLLCLFGVVFGGLFTHLAFGIPKEWLGVCYVVSIAVCVAAYARLLLVTGLRLGPADRNGSHPGPRFPSVHQWPWKSYAVAFPLFALTIASNFYEAVPPEVRDFWLVGQWLLAGAGSLALLWPVLKREQGSL